MRDLETPIAKVLNLHQYNGADLGHHGPRVEYCTCGWFGSGEGAHGRHQAAEIVAVVRPRIETVEQLDALPEGAVVRSDDGGVYVKDHRYTQAGEPWWPAGYDVECGSESIHLPARVIHLPEVGE